jgi:hypothetical protein
MSDRLQAKIRKKPQRVLSLPFLSMAVCYALLTPTRADSGAPIVFFNCVPDEHAVYIKTAVSYEEYPTFGNEHAINVDKLTEKGKRLECALSSTQRVVANIHVDFSHPRNDGVEVWVDKKFLWKVPFCPFHDASFLVTVEDDKEAKAIYFEDGIPRKSPQIVVYYC